MCNEARDGREDFERKLSNADVIKIPFTPATALGRNPRLTTSEKFLPLPPGKLKTLFEAM